MQHLLADNSFGHLAINFFSGFFGTPAILLGTIALIGCFVQHKKFTEIVISTFKTIIGFLIISGGAAVISESIQKFGNAFTLLFNRSGYLPNNDPIPGIIMGIKELEWIATCGSLILIFGMILNMILAKVTRFKYLYLSGSGAWYFSTMLASVMAVAGVQKADMWLIILTGSLLVSLYMAMSPSLLNKWMPTVTGSPDIAMAHTGNLSYWIGGNIGDMVHKIRVKHKADVKIRSTEDINFPQGLAFLRNTNVSIALTMLILFFSVYCLAWGIRGRDLLVAKGVFNDSDSIFVQIILQSFKFAAGVEILVMGVQMFVAQIMPTFQGLSDRFIDNAKPGLDCTIILSYAPNAVLIGFLASLVGGIVMFAINIGVSAAIASTAALGFGAIIIPSIVPHFFTGATSGILGNARGGIIGCIIAGFVNGIIIQIVPWIFIGLAAIQGEIVDSNPLVWGDADFLLGIIPWVFIKYLGGKWVLFGITLAVWSLFPILGTFNHHRKLQKSETYRETFHQSKTERLGYLKATKELRNEARSGVKKLKDNRSHNLNFQMELEQFNHDIDQKTKDLEKMHNDKMHAIRSGNFKAETIDSQIEKNHSINYK